MLFCFTAQWKANTTPHVSGWMMKRFHSTNHVPGYYRYAPNLHVKKRKSCQVGLSQRHRSPTLLSVLTRAYHNNSGILSLSVSVSDSHRQVTAV